MDGIKINLENVIDELTENIKNYTERVEEEVADAVDKCTLETEREIRKNSPVGKTGDFKDGWDRFNYRKKSGRAGVVKNYPKCLLQYGSGDTETDAEITFADGSVRIANYIEKIPSSIGFICSCGRNDVTEDEFDYVGAISREIKKRIADGEVLGNNMMLTRYQGAVFLYNEKVSETARSAEETAVEKYGFTVNKGGYTQYDGIMSSGKEATSVKVDTENNTVKVEFADGHNYTYSANVVKNGSTYTINDEKEVWE